MLGKFCWLFWFGSRKVSGWSWAPGRLRARGHLLDPVGRWCSRRDVENVRALAGRAAAALQHTSSGDDEITVLARGRLRARNAFTDGMRWATLGWTDGSGLATVPVAAIESFERVLAEAERELTELGLVAFRAVCRPNDAHVVRTPKRAALSRCSHRGA